MGLDELLKQRVIGSIKADRPLALKTFQLSRRDLQVARKVLEEGSNSWGFAIAYNSMLQAGYTDEISERLIAVLDRVRKKRHTTLYDEPDAISEQEASNAILWASEFVLKVENVLKKEDVIKQ